MQGNILQKPRKPALTNCTRYLHLVGNGWNDKVLFSSDLMIPVHSLGACLWSGEEVEGGLGAFSHFLLKS